MATDTAYLYFYMIYTHTVYPNRLYIPLTYNSDTQCQYKHNKSVLTDYSKNIHNVLLTDKLSDTNCYPWYKRWQKLLIL